MVHSSYRGLFMPTQTRLDNTRQAIAAGAVMLSLLMPAGASDTALATGRAAADSSAALTTSANLRIADLVLKEKKNRELELQRKLPTTGLPVPEATPKMPDHSSTPSSATRPVLWSLSGAAGSYQAEIVWANRLLVVHSEQATIPLLGTLEYMDETGVYIRPGRRQRVNKAWLDSDGLLVLPSPRVGQADPILVEVSNQNSHPRPALHSAAHLPNALPVNLPAKSLASQPTPWILASGELKQGNVDLSAPKKIELLPVMTAPAVAGPPLKGSTAVPNTHP
jgi:hypothetical protein